MLLPAGAKLQFTPGSAASIDADAEWELLDATTFAFAGAFQNSIVGYVGTSAQDLITAIPAGMVARVHNISIRNKHATASTAMLVVKWLTGPILVEKCNPVLLPKWHIEFKDGVWFCYGDKLDVITGPMAGRYLRTWYLQAGTTFTTGVDTETLKIKALGGGAAGGGAATVAAGGGAGGGGSAGGYAEKTFDVLPNTGYTIAIGAAGAPGAAGANAGGNGGNTTMTVGATTVTANGGRGGTGMASGTTVLAALGGAATPISTNGDLNASGMPGNPGIRLSGTVGVSGAGGDSLLGGAGDAGRITQGNGAAGIGPGAGGSGGLTLNAGAATAGGAGTTGMLVIEEYT